MREPHGPEWLSPARAWFLVGVMFLTFVAGQIDRQVMAILVQEMKRDLHFTDEQLGLLMGFGFSLTYAVSAIFVAYLGDRISRRKVLAGGLVLWSALTALCGLASTFPAMLIARLGVGVGESVLSPTALPMVAGAFPPERRPLPIAICIAGSPVGLVLTPILVGFIIHATQGKTYRLLPALPMVHGWQLAFLMCGLIGLIILLLFMFVQEPRNEEAGKQAATVPEALKHFASHPRFYAGVFFALPILAAGNYALIAWMPAYLARTFELNYRDIGLLNGAGFLPAALLGPLVAAMLGRYAARSAVDRIHFKIMLALTPVLGSMVALPMLMPTAVTATIAFAAAAASTSVAITYGLTNAQQVVLPRYRSQATAVVMASFMLIGNGAGPALAGTLATRVVGEDSLGKAVLLCLLILVPLSALASGLALSDRRRPPHDTEARNPRRSGVAIAANMLGSDQK